LKEKNSAFYENIDINTYNRLMGQNKKMKERIKEYREEIEEKEKEILTETLESRQIECSLVPFCLNN